MQGKSEDDAPPQWSVRAQFTISHPGVGDPNASPQTHTEKDENGVHMYYTWTSQPNSQTNNNQGIPTETPTVNTTGVAETNRQPLPTAYGFQRGNLLFTSIPPRRPTTLHPNQGSTVHDSGYNSELLSPNFHANTGLPRRVLQPYNRKCKSTCSIVLSTTIDEQPELEECSNSVTQQTHCSRTQSLRCQTPTIRSEQPSGFYGCGDPWCYHSGSTYGDDAPFSPGQGSEASCSTAATVLKRPSSFLPATLEHVRAENRLRDAAVQTFEMVDKSTSPFPLTDPESTDNSFKKEKNAKKRLSYGSRSRTEPLFCKTHSPSSFTPDSLENNEPIRRIGRVLPKLQGKAPFLSDRQSSASDSKSSDPNKKPRTVHIDVYCTGTEQESEESSSDVESKTVSSPQTVFESEKVRITHSRSDDNNLPMKLKGKLLTAPAGDRKNLLVKQHSNTNESDNDDNTSTAYPSQLSSYSAIGGLSSFSSSVPPSWSTYSMSVDNDYDSVANTSWKDTFSDFDSINRSRSSIAQTESLDFIPRRLLPVQASGSIEEHPEIARKNLETPSIASLNPSDSFEYANSEDKLRIRRMEQMWSQPENRPVKSPQLERKHLLQQQKLKEYVDKRLSNISIVKSESKDSDSGSDSSEKGWSFVKNEEKKLNRDCTVRRTSKEGDTTFLKAEPLKGGILKTELSPTASRRSVASRSPSAMALQERLKTNPTLRAPFMVVPGIFTDQRYVAKRFGSVVDVFRKPGHHVGPAKNPDCQCDHCRSYFENGGRGRTRSVSEATSSVPWTNWRNVRYSQPRDTGMGQAFNEC